MEIEKVKEIKKALKQNIKTGIGFLDEKEDKMFFVSIAEILTLINELENENERLQEQNGALSCDLEYINEKLTNAEIEVDDYKDRIAELENIGLNEKITVGEYLREMQRSKDRVAELEKEIEENAFYSKGYAQGIKNTYEVVMPDKLKQFAEMLKEKFNDTEYRAMTKRKTISVEELKAQMDWILHEVVIKNIYETLKEFIK